MDAPMTSQRDPLAALRRTSFQRSELPCLRGVRVLIADDSLDNQAIFMRMLAASGADVDAVADGAQAVAVEGLSEYDVIIMDIRMPILDGYEATRRIRERGFRGPILALTAHATPGERERCLTAGANRFLTKPIDRAGLVHAVWDASAGREPID